jgi:hypothetical protein
MWELIFCGILIAVNQTFNIPDTSCATGVFEFLPWKDPIDSIFVYSEKKVDLGPRFLYQAHGVLQILVVLYWVALAAAAQKRRQIGMESYAINSLDESEVKKKS